MESSDDEIDGTNKEARQEAEPLAADNVPTENRIYFDLLPENRCENITRYTSAQPNSKGWSSFINERDVAAMYRVEGEFGKFICGRFEAINVYGAYPFPNTTDNTICIQCSYISYGILRQAGPNLKTVRISLDIDTMEEIVSSGLLQELSKTDADIEVMASPSYELLEFWEAAGKRVKKLHLWWDESDSKIAGLFDGPVRSRKLDRENEIISNSMHAICWYCRNLRELTMEKRCDFMEASFFPDFNIWESLGGSLEILTMNGLEGTEYQMGHIAKYCRHLKSIRVKIEASQYGSFREKDVITFFSDCLASWKSQLEYARIPQTSRENMEKVVSSCQNAMFEFTFDGTIFLTNSPEIELYACLNILGKKLEKVTVFHPREGENLHLRTGWDFCPNLKEVTFRNTVFLRDIEALLKTPKLHLKSLEFGFIPRSDLKKVTEAFSAVTTLESLRLTCMAPLPSTFGMLVKNRNLHDVRIEFRHDPDLSVRNFHLRVSEIALLFLSVPALEVLKINDFFGKGHFPEVEESCRTKYRYRRVIVSIFQVYYSTLPMQPSSLPQVNV